MKTEKRYLVPNDYMADPAVHVLTIDSTFIPLTTGKAGLPKMIMGIISI